MELNEYQKKAMETCMPTCENFSYMFLNLVGEVGEFSSKIAKAIRQEKAHIVSQQDENGVYDFYNDLILCGKKTHNIVDTARSIMELKNEAGDILWQLSGLCKIMNWNLEDVAKTNLDKLASRKKRGVIDGNGDNR